MFVNDKEYCDVCNKEIEKDSSECIYCGAIWCEGCNAFVPCDDMGEDIYCCECENDRAISKAESLRDVMYDMG